MKNAEEFVANRVDLVLEFQAEESAAPRIANIFKKADIPLVAIDVPHPNATYFGVDNFECGFEAGVLLAQHAHRKWRRRADVVLGVGFAEAGSFVQSRITGAFDAVREGLAAGRAGCRFQLEGAACVNQPAWLVAHFLRGRRKGEAHSCGCRERTRAHWAFWMRLARRGGKPILPSSARIAFPRRLPRCSTGKSALIGSIFAPGGNLWGRDWIQLGISLLRG